jgi:porin
MQKCTSISVPAILFACVVTHSIAGHAIEAGASADPAGSKQTVPVRTLEDLNLKGGIADNPPFTDSLLGVDSQLRRTLFHHGLLFRMAANSVYVQNTLASPLAADDQHYTRQRQFFGYSLNPVLSADLRQFGLHRAQLNINGQIQQSTWEPAQPYAATVTSIYVYKEFGEDRAELKIGYITSDFQFIGLQVGGQVASGAQGVYAVLPYEVGLSYSPIPAPAITLKYRFSDGGVYIKGGVQRAGQPGSLESALRRDAVGLRFLPHGNKLVLVGEGGRKHAASTGSLASWYRLGYIVNSTPYSSLRTGEPKAGNYCAYVLADQQLWQPQVSLPGRGVFVGGSAMFVPTDLNVYRLYYEARLYYAGPFRRRPGDFASVVASYTAYSQDTIRSLAAAGKTYWRASDSVTGSYTARVARGTYVGLGLSYVNGPSVTPRVPSALTFTAQTSVFF